MAAPYSELSKEEVAHIVSSQVGLLLASQDLQCCALADTIRAHQPKNLSNTRCRKSMQLEGVGAVSMGGLVLEVGGELNDVDGLKGALFGADTATDAERLRDECNFGCWCNLDAQPPHSNNWAALLALLSTFLGLALLGRDNGNTRLFGRRCWCRRHGCCEVLLHSLAC